MVFRDKHLKPTDLDKEGDWRLCVKP